MTPTVSQPATKAISEAHKLRFAIKRALNVRLADLFRRANLPEEAQRLDSCQTDEVLFFCSSCGAHQYRIQSCKLRFCSFCSFPRIAQLKEKVSAIAASVHRPKLLTLTMPPVQDLAAGIDYIKKAFSGWRRLKPIAALVKGGCYTIEIVPKDHSWHVHIHAVIQSEFLPVATIATTWARSLRIEHANIDIREIKSAKGIAEAVKYITKQATLIDMPPEQLHDYVTCLKKRRLFGTFGTWFNPDWDALLAPDDYEPVICPDCAKPGSFYPIFLGPILFKDHWDHFRDLHLQNLPDRRTADWITNDQDGNASLFDPPAYHIAQRLHG